LYYTSGAASFRHGHSFLGSIIIIVSPQLGSSTKATSVACHHHLDRFFLSLYFSSSVIMPKAKRIRSAALEAQLTRHQPLGQVIAQDAARQGGGKLRNKTKWKARRGAKDNNNDKDEEEEELLLDTKTSQRILALSKHQQLEMETEGAMADVEARRRRIASLSSKSPSAQQQRKRRNGPKDDSDDDDDDDDEKEEEDNEAWEDAGDGIVRDDDRYISVAEGTLSPEDEALVNAMMMNNDVGGTSQQQQLPRKSLADLILEKIEEKESAVLTSSRPDEEPVPGSLPPKVVHVYTEIGKLLSRYTSGKLPKAFKVIPSLTHWEDVLYLCRPDLWTPQAMYAATRIFASNLNPQMAQRFYNLVLLDAVRADIQRNKKLNYHYYMALKKGTFLLLLLLRYMVSSDSHPAVTDVVSNSPTHYDNNTHTHSRLQARGVFQGYSTPFVSRPRL
jgi:essential nuclear protein 1